MQDIEPATVQNLDGYGVAPIEWDRVREVLSAQASQAPDTGGPGRHTTWLTTVSPDGTPHVVPVGAIVLDGTWHFTSGPATRKSRNIDRDPRCVISVATRPFDIVLHGTVRRVMDASELQAAAEAYAAQGWPASVAGDALTAEFSAPSAGPPPWNLYRLQPSTVFAFGTAEPFGATRFDLE